MLPHSTVLLVGALAGGASAFHAPLARQPQRMFRRTAAAAAVASPPVIQDEPPVLLSGLNGRALRVEMEDIPTKAEIRDAVPARCFERSTPRSLFYLLQSLAVTGACFSLHALIPLKLAAWPLWLAYATVTGTAATGLWVIAHECGHGAFSDHRLLQDSVG
jgi:hypothetical protein